MSALDAADPASPSAAPRARIQVPDLPEGAVDRHGLLDRHSASGPLPEVLLVCASAGFGKTTLLTQWAHRARADGRTVAWVTCRMLDSDPTALFVDVRDAAAFAVRAAAPQISGSMDEFQGHGTKATT